MEDFECTPEMKQYTDTFVKTIENIKRRHDPVVTTVGKFGKRAGDKREIKIDAFKPIR